MIQYTIGASLLPTHADFIWCITAATPLAHYATLHSVCSPPDAGYCPPHICSSKHSVN